MTIYNSIMRSHPSEMPQGIDLLRTLHPWFSASVGINKNVFNNHVFWRLEPIPLYIARQLIRDAYPPSGPTVHGLVSQSFWKELVKFQKHNVQILITNKPLFSSHNGAKTYVKQNTIVLHLPTLHPATLAQEALRFKLYNAYVQAPPAQINNIPIGCLQPLKAYFGTLYATLATTHLTQNLFNHFDFQPQLLNFQDSQDYRTFLAPSFKYNLEFRIDGPLKKKAWDISNAGICPQIYSDYTQALNQAVINNSIVDKAAHLRMLMDTTEFLTLNLLHCQIFPGRNCFQELSLRSTSHTALAQDTRDVFHKELQDADAQRLPKAQKRARHFSKEHPQEHLSLCRGSQAYKTLFCKNLKI